MASSSGAGFVRATRVGVGRARAAIKHISKHEPERPENRDLESFELLNDNQRETNQLGRSDKAGTPTPN